MPAATVSELYVNADDPSSTLGAPPAPPVTPAPAPVKAAEPVVVTQRKMADQGPDGRTRDTSTEALRPGNDLGFREFDPDPKEQTDVSQDRPAVEAKEGPGDTAPAAESHNPEPPKLYAGKYKSIEELEKGYEEAQSAMTKAQQKAAELERNAVQKAAEPAKPVEKTPAQAAAEEKARQDFLNRFVENPEGVVNDYVAKAQQTTAAALAAQQMMHNWKQNNPDLAEHEVRVAFEMAQLMQSDPELAKDSQALLDKATANFRQFTGKLRTEGAKEALTTETKVIRLSESTAPEGSTRETSSAGKGSPMSRDESFDLSMKFLKDQERRSHRGLRP